MQMCAVRVASHFTVFSAWKETPGRSGISSNQKLGLSVIDRISLSRVFRSVKVE